jgi:SAM-dependent methyltransferase
MSAMRWDAERYVREASFVPANGMPVIDLLGPQRGERILDLGCGDGALTVVLTEHGADVVGVDASPEMVAAARARGLRAEVVDATSLAFDGEFDAVFSNAVLHWIADLPAVLAGVRAALRPGGRFVGECGGSGNVAALGLAVTAARLGRGFPAPANPWRNRSREELAAAFADAGFRVERIDHFPRPTPLPDGLASWLQIFGAPLLADLPHDARAAVIADAVAVAVPWLADTDGNVTADYVRLRFAAVREG